MIRIGVVADTHCPEFLAELPDALLDALRGVDLVIHSGDVGGAGGERTLQRLRDVAPVHAVAGDHDRGLGLPRRLELEVGGRRIGVIHGDRHRFLEEPVTLVGTLSLGLLWPNPGLHRWLRRQFPRADIVIYGHTHNARADRVGGALIFNPGAVYLVNRAEARRRLAARPGWFEWCWLQVIRHRRDRQAPSLGLLEIDAAGIRASIIPVG